MALENELNKNAILGEDELEDYLKVNDEEINHIE